MREDAANHRSVVTTEATMLAADPEYASIIAAIAELHESSDAHDAPDALTMRAEIDAGVVVLADVFPRPDGLEEETYTVEADDGTAISLLWCAATDDATMDGVAGPAVVYLHGGGMICGSAELFAPVMRRHVEATGVPFLSVDYRLAPEFPHPVPVEDCFAGLRWLHEHADELGVDPARIAVMGESAGGGLAAGVALLARDRQVPLAHQILVFPMLDDRNTVPDPELVPFCASWSYESNAVGWQALLGDRCGEPDVPATAAPARAVDLSGLAPAYLDVGTLDIFRDEDVDYACRLGHAGVAVELHVHAGVPHGYDLMAPNSAVARRAAADRRRVIQSF